MIDSHVLFEGMGSFHKWKDLDLTTILEHSVLAPNPILLFQEKYKHEHFIFQGDSCSLRMK